MRSSHAENTFGKNVYQKIKESKVLMVGAGGIGCELLKDLVLLGFKEIHIVDLDTIDLSNLNRQFLFGHEHIKKSKSLVAKETASKFNPNANIVAYHDNIKDEKFDVAWFGQFDIVYNALDNMDARRHVNRICLAANVPLIESGTTGFNGQVSVIINGKTECYDCTSKLTPKSYPVCTIRSTPSQPVHNIVWAKSYLFSQLWDEDYEDVHSALEDDSGADSVEEKQNMQREANELKELRKSILDEDAFVNLVNKIFDTDIERLIAMKEMWKSRKPPSPLKFDSIAPNVEGLDGHRISTEEDQQRWSIEENLAVLKNSIERLQKKFKTEGPLSFDKDDEDTLDFVVSTANIRSHLFNIDTKSKFECKQIAGNIIPAVATINAMIAGVCVLQSIKVLEQKYDELKFVFIANEPDKIFMTDKLNKPNPYCVVSGIDRATLQIDPEQYTLNDMIESLKSVNFSNEISILTDRLLYDPDFEDNANRTLADLNIKCGNFITAVDEDDETNHVNLEVYIEKGDSGLIRIPETFKTKPPKREEEDSQVQDVEEPVAAVGEKRIAAGDTDEQPDTKRIKTDTTNEGKDDQIVIEEDDDIVEID